jgi:hypothetical protein
MSETIEHAREGIEEADHAHALHGDSTARRIAVLIAVLAAALALAEMGEKGAQNEYLTHHVAVADEWAFYQAKTVRATVLAAEAGILANLPNAADPGPQAEINRRAMGRSSLPSGRRRRRRHATRPFTGITSSSSWSERCRSPSCWHRSPW